MGTQALDARRASLDVVLTNLSLGIAPDQELIGNSLLPTLMRPTSTTTIGVWGTEAFRVREDKVGDYSEPDKLDVSIDKTTFEIDGHALMAPISDRHQIEGLRGPLGVNFEEEAVRTVRFSMDLARERAQATLLTASGTYTGSGHVIDLNSPSHPWDNSSNDPLEDIVPVIESVIPNDSGRRPNTMWMGQEVWAGLLTNTKVRDRLFGTHGPQPTPTLAQFASLVGLDNVYVGRAMTKTSAGVNTKVWGKKAGILYVPPTSGARIPAFGYTVEQSVFGGGSEAIIRFRDEKMGASGGDQIKRSAFYTPVCLFPDAGVLFTNAVS